MLSGLKKMALISPPNVTHAPGAPCIPVKKHKTLIFDACWLLQSLSGSNSPTAMAMTAQTHGAEARIPWDLRFKPMGPINQTHGTWHSIPWL